MILTNAKLEKLIQEFNEDYEGTCEITLPVALELLKFHETVKNLSFMEDRFLYTLPEKLEEIAEEDEYGASSNDDFETYPHVKFAVKRLNLPEEVQEHIRENCTFIAAGYYTRTITAEELEAFHTGKDLIIVDTLRLVGENMRETSIADFATEVALSYLNARWRGKQKTKGELNQEYREARKLAESWGWKTLKEVINPTIE